MHVLTTHVECQELKLDQYMSPIADSMAARATSRPPTDEMNAWRTHGLQLIAQGKVACILLAGGQVKSTLFRGDVVGSGPCLVRPY